MRWLHDFETNKEDILFGWVHYSDLKTLKSQDILERTGHIIMSLRYNYKEEGQIDDFNKLKEFVLRLPFNNEFKDSLIKMGFRDKLGIEL